MFIADWYYRGAGADAGQFLSSSTDGTPGGWLLRNFHPLVRSTNLLERFFREFRAKADEIGAFPNQTSCLTLFHLVLVREHAKHDRLEIAKTG